MKILWAAAQDVAVFVQLESSSLLCFIANATDFWPCFRIFRVLESWYLRP
jgi:hypothetical protein